MQAYWAGMGTSFGLIVAIGAQNAFVLRQGLMRQHVFWTCVFCALSDAVLISIGVAGAGALAERAPIFIEIMRWGGCLFLLIYGAKAFLSAWRGGAVMQAGQGAASLGRTLAVVAALTWLNPHVWLDAVLLLGSLATAYGDRASFALGAITASALFFFALGYGARLLVPIFARPAAWRVLDLSVGVVMWLIAYGLAFGGSIL